MITYESLNSDKRVKLGNMYFTCICYYNRGIKVVFPDWPPSILSFLFLTRQFLYFIFGFQIKYG